MEPDRYVRQARLPEVGAEGQARLGSACCVIVGVGATGSAVAPALVRAGVGSVRVVDRDIVERSNLQRQMLYGDADAEAATPKVEAAVRALRAANGDVEVEGVAEDLHHRNVARVLGGAACVVDGTDNFETRFLVNDWCVREGVPWIYTGVVGTTGHSFVIVPGVTACFRCYLPDPPPFGVVDTCETAGVLGPLVLWAGALAATEALKLCMGRLDEVRRGMCVLDGWRGTMRTLALEKDPGCEACGARRFPWLEGRGAPAAEALCGRDAVMVRPPEGAERRPLEEVARRLREAGGVSVREGGVALGFGASGLEATVFADGRVIVRGTSDAGRARAFCARYLG